MQYPFLYFSWLGFRDAYACHCCQSFIQNPRRLTNGHPNHLHTFSVIPIWCFPICKLFLQRPLFKYHPRHAYIPKKKNRQRPSPTLQYVSELYLNHSFISPLTWHYAWERERERRERLLYMEAIQNIHAKSTQNQFPKTPNSNQLNPKLKLLRTTM